MLDQEMDSINYDAKKLPHALRQGIIWGLVGVVINLGLYLTGNLEASLTGQGNMAVSIFSGLANFAISIWFVLAAIRAFRADKGTLTFGDAVSTGTLTGLIYGVIAAVWAFVLFTFLFPDFQEFMQEAIITQYEEQGLGEEEIEMALSWTGMFTSPMFMILASIPSGAITGAIISLIAGIFMKTE